MVWAELSNAAKGILEMTEGPNSGIRYAISVRVGERPRFDGQFGRSFPKVVDRQLFEEMVSYLRESDEDYETRNINEDGFEIRIAAVSRMPASS